MANQLLVVQDIPDIGVAPTPVVLASGINYQVPNDGRTVLRFTNTGGTPVTVTLIAQATILGHPISNPTITVAATSGEEFVGKLAPELYNDSSGYVNFTVSGACDVEVMRE